MRGFIKISKMKKIRLAIISLGSLPVPAVNGGAVENLIENLVKVNCQKKDDVELYIYSCYNNLAEQKAICNYSDVNFKYIKINNLIKVLDKFVYNFMKIFFPKKKLISFRYIFQRLFFIKKTACDLYKEKYDFIVFENSPTLLSVLKYKNNYDLYKNKYSYHIHNTINNYFGNEIYLKRCPLFFGVSEYINSEIKKILNEKDEKFKVLKNRVDEKIFSQEIKEEDQKSIFKKYNLPSDAKIVLFTGRISKEKGIIELLNAFNRIKNDKLYLLIVGSQYFNSDVKNSFNEKIRKLAKEKENNIIITGYIDNSDIWKFYKVSDIVVLPSIWDDPAPLTVIESIITNSALITTNSGGISEYVDNKCSVILDKDNNLINELENNILLLIENPNKVKELKYNMKIKANEMTISHYYEDFCNIVKNFISEE